MLKNDYGKGFKENLLEQYTMYVATAEKTSDNRKSTNKFYLTLNSSVFVLSSYLSLAVKEVFLNVLFAVGIVISILWIKNILSYKQLNKAKYDVIHEMEKNLPASVFTVEWELLEKGDGRKYTQLTSIESFIPIIFIALYIIMLFLSLEPFHFI